MRLRNDINNLKETDIYSLVLFVLYKLISIPEYSALSELCYVLDKDNLLKLCEYFGGTTIKVPTIHELEMLVYSLLLYQYVNIDGIPYDKAISNIGLDSNELREVKTNYAKLSEILVNYDFNLGR